MSDRILSGGVPDPVRHDSKYIDHVSQAELGFKVFPDRLYVVTPVTNITRSKNRLKLYRQFAKHMEESGVVLVTVEMAFGERPFEVTTRDFRSDKEIHVQVRGPYELWYKENLCNIGFQYCPPEATKIAWIDCDSKFLREDWAQETMHQLQHYKVVQLWSTLQDLSPNYELLKVNYPHSWCFNYCNGMNPISIGIGGGKQRKLTEKDGCYPYPYPSNNGWYGPPGLAWAARREALNELGGLIDWGIIGSADAYMAAALIGGVQHQLRKDYHPEFKNQFMIWQDRAEKCIRRNIGYVPGTVLHYWHGPKSKRQYVDRNKIMSDLNFNPLTDLKRDIQGLWQLVDHGDVRSIELRDRLRQYFRSRDEDSTEMDD
jgi:hypothetical protein